MVPDNSGQHRTSSRRAAAKARHKERARAQTQEHKLAETAEREARRRDKEQKRQHKKQKAKEPEPAGLTAPLAGVGLVIVLIIILILVYQTFVAANGTSEQSVPYRPPSETKASADQPVALASLASLASATTAPRNPLPGNPALAERLSVAVAGDVMMDRNVSDLIDAEGGAAPLEDVAPILKRADVAIVNLETPLSTRGQARDKDVTFRGNPKGIKALTTAGIDFVTLANNHALDYGPDALADTLDLLDTHRIAYAGAGMNRQEAWQSALIRTKGKRVAYLAWSYIEPAGFLAEENSPGIAGAKQNTKEIAQAIRQAKRGADFVIVAFHWGVEYTDYPIDSQEELGRAAIDAGADLVAAHHPHVIQGIEVYNKKLIAYSLGDFVFDHDSRKTGEAFILEARLTRTKTLTARAIPVYLSESGKPSVVSGEEADSILGRLKKISEGFGTRIRIADDVATLVLPK